MKKVLPQVCLLFSLIFCNPTISSSQTGASEIRGNWEITEITSPGSGSLSATIFGIAESKCFIGSTWNFAADNKGSLKLNASGCTSFSSDIEWNAIKNDEIVLKITGAKSKTATQEFTLKLSDLTEDSFQLTEKATVSGKSQEIVYHFEKIFEFR